MSEPDERLSSFDPGPAMNPLPPSDVRRRGDRLRRRNTVLASAGAALAVAVIVTPLAILGTRGDGDASPDPAPPAPSPSVTLPDGIDITTGMAENESREPVVATAGGEGIAEMVMCDAAGLPESGVLDRLAAHASGPEYTDSRELRLYGSVDEARAVIDGVVDAVEECPTEDFTTTTWVNQISERQLGEESYTVSTTYLENGEPTIGGIWWHVVRVGNAIFAASGTGEVYPGPDHERFLEEDADQLAPIVNGFVCLFSDESCSNDAGEPPSGESPVAIWDDFPLTAGWPEPGGDSTITGPDRDQEPLVFSVCGANAPDPAHSDRVTAVHNGPEDYRTRQLTSYQDADAAVAAVTALVNAFQACPQDEVDEAGYVTNYEVQQLTAGGESWAILARDTMEGGNSPFGATTIIVRVGLAVLVLDHGGHAGYPSGDDDLQATLDEAAEPIAAMCAFTEAGCA